MRVAFLPVAACGLSLLTTIKGLTTDSLVPIERTVRKVMSQWPPETRVRDLGEHERETWAVAQHLQRRLQNFRRNGDCGRCWLQKAHCICADCPPLEDGHSTSPLAAGSAMIRRVFVLTHHKEICLVYDTAKLIAASFPWSCRIVVGGISDQYQESMQEMLKCLAQKASSCLILFPSEHARTWNEIQSNVDNGHVFTPPEGWNIIVLDGTWEQARRLYRRHVLPAVAAKDFHSAPLHVRLSDESLESILSEQSSPGASQDMQLRRHPEQWRQISTLAALRLFLSEMIPRKSDTWSRLGEYQECANRAARQQLGPVRLRQTNEWQ